MPALEDFKNFFNKNEEERSLLYSRQNATILKKDKKIASYLGTKDFHLIATIREILHIYDWAQQKKLREELVTEKENELIEDEPDSKHLLNNIVLAKAGPSPMEITPIQAIINKNSNSTKQIPMEFSLTQPNQLNDKMLIDEVGTSCKRSFSDQEDISTLLESKAETTRDILLQNEARALDYGLEELINKRQNPQKQPRKEPLTRKKTKYYENIYNSKWAPKGSFTSTTATNTTIYYFTLWDLPKEMSAREIKKYLSYFGTASILAWQQNYNSKAAYIKIITNVEKRESSLRENWSIHLDQGKTYRTTPGKFSNNELEQRNKYRATITNVPKIATDSLLLRQLKKHKAQAVHILNNCNGNQSRRAHIYFKTEAELVQAQKHNLYYFNTKLEWQTMLRDSSANRNLNNPNTCKGLTIDNNKGKQPIYESGTYNKHSLDKNLENTNATTKTNRLVNDNKKIERNEDRQKKNSKTDTQRNKKPADKDTRTSIQNKNKTSNKENSNQMALLQKILERLDILEEKQTRFANRS